METKTIALDLEAYEALRRQKREGESFSDVVRRLAGERRPLADLAGLWADMPSAAFRKFQEFRRASRETEAKRLVKGRA